MKHFLSIVLVTNFYLFLDIKAQNTPCFDCSKTIFLVDNSASIDNQKYSDMKTSINQISSQLINNNPYTQIAIIQYASSASGIHNYDISVPFTNNMQTLISWNRIYMDLDHLPGSLSEMRLDGIWDVSGKLDIVTESCSINFFIFTDAVKGYSCCSYLTNTGDAPNALPNYDEYNYLKTHYGVNFTVYHVLVDLSSNVAGAAISSVGGSYSGMIDNNVNDPQGNGALPRKYFPGSTFLLSQAQIENIVTEIKTDTCTDSSSDLFIPNVFTPNGDGINNFFSITKRNIIKIGGVIYNRWGMKVAQWNNLNYEWDGKNQTGKDVPEGTYYYIINAEGSDKKKYLRKGYLTLLR